MLLSPFNIMYPSQTQNTLTLQPIGKSDFNIENSLVYTELPKFFDISRALENFDKIQPTKNQVENFLNKNIHLLNDLNDGIFVIKQILKKSKVDLLSLDLELHRDPEEEWEKLFIEITAKCDYEKAIELEDKIFEEWYSQSFDNIFDFLNYSIIPCN